MKKKCFNYFADDIFVPNLRDWGKEQEKEREEERGKERDRTL
jgi:hypothetical protein